MSQQGIFSNFKKIIYPASNVQASKPWYDEPFIFEPKVKGFRAERELIYYACDKGLRSGSLTCMMNQNIVSHINALIFCEKEKHILTFSLERISATQYMALATHLPDLERYWKQAYQYEFQKGNLTIWVKSWINSPNISLNTVDINEFKELNYGATD